MSRPTSPHMEALKQRLMTSAEAHIDDLLRDIPYWAPEVQPARIVARINSLCRSLHTILTANQGAPRP